MYKTKVQALQAADDGLRTRSQRLWVYQCDYCSAWHLTHSAPVPEYPHDGGARRKPQSRKRGYKPRKR